MRIICLPGFGEDEFIVDKIQEDLIVHEQRLLRHVIQCVAPTL